MAARGWFAVHVLVYASFAIGCVMLRTSRRVIFLYVYIAIMLVIGGFFGALYSVPITSTTSVSGGSLAYGAFMMGSLLLVVVGRDTQVIRTAIWIVLGVNAFKLAVFAMVASSLQAPALLNPFDTSPDVFRLSIRVVMLGGALIVCELLLLILAMERLKVRFGRGVAGSLLYVVLYLGALMSDGVLFPLVVLPWRGHLLTTMQAGMQTKLVLGLAYAVPLTVFLVLSRGRLAQYQATPLRLQELFLTPKDDLVREIERQDEVLAAQESRARELVAHSTDLIFVTDRSGVIGFVNPSAARLLGVGAQEAVGMAGFDLLQAPDPTAIRHQFEETVQVPGKVSPLTQVQARHADGTLRVLEMVWNNQLHNAAIRGIVVNIRDVTDRVAYERLLETHRAILTKIALGEPLLDCLVAVAGVLRERWPHAAVLTYAVMPDDDSDNRSGDEVAEVTDSWTARLLVEVGLSDEPSQAAPRMLGPVRLGDLPSPARAAALTLLPTSGPLQPEDVARDPLLKGQVAMVARCAYVLPVLGRGTGQLTALVCVYVDEERTLVEQPSAALGTAALLTQIALERQADVDRLLHLALHDELTGLPNRVLFLDRLDQALERERPGRYVGVLFCDLDDFKLVNETLGHRVGDELLNVIAGRLTSLLTPGDTVARFGGDEFVLLCSGLRDQQAALATAERMLSAVRQTVPLGDSSRTGTASIGVTMAGRGGCHPDLLVAQADAAMYRAKAAGRNQAALYNEELQLELRQRFETERALACAVDRDELLLHYQPQIDVRSGEVVAVEALVRWDRPGYGLLPPAAFVPIAEDTGLIVALGTWVLNEACRQAAQWGRAGHPLSVSVNVSARQLTRPDIAALVQQALQDSGLDPGQLCLEITETAIMEDAAHLTTALDQLSRLGVKISIDDFGTGYSSLLYLKRLKVHELKIDMEFVQGLGIDPEDTAIVEAIISLASALGLTTVAEGVETPQQRDLLTGLGCTRLQGFLLGRPSEQSVLMQWLVGRRHPTRTV